MKKVSAFIFDMDGTMIDNMGYHLKSWIELFNRLGVRMQDREFHVQYSGKTTDEILVDVLGEQITKSEIKALSETKEDIYRELYRPHLQPVPGLERFLEKARELSIPMAVATSAMRKNINFVLDGLGVAAYFRVVIGAEDIQHSKPHPETFLKAAQSLSVATENCLVFEDSLAGIEAARRGGMQSVLVDTALSADQVNGIESVIRVINDFTELDPAELINYRFSKDRGVISRDLDIDLASSDPSY
jgi:beta-phosphoglucomutase